MSLRRFSPMIAFAVALVAAAAWADKVDDVARAELKRQRIPGMSIVVVRDGKIIKEAGYGLANIELNVPATPETIYQSGSVGKQFTAALVMLLVEDGKIALDDPISKYLPSVPESWKKITIRHLLTHTSGLGDPYEKLDFRKDYTDEELLKIDGEVPMKFAPGEKWAYSNMGYHVLGFLCNKVGGKFYTEQLRERIFQPAGMTTARLISERDIVPNRAAGYEFEKNEPKNQGWVSPSLNTTADGSLYLTVRDMARWDAALYGDKLLKRSSLDQIWTPVKLNDGKTYPYGFGWMLEPVNGRKCISHGGAWQGFTTAISRFVDDKLTVIVLTNRAGANPGKIAQLIASEYVPALKPQTPKSIEDKEPKVTALVRDVLLKAADGTLTKEPFTTEMAAFIFPERANDLGEALKSFGPLKELHLIERQEEAGVRQYRYRALYQEGAAIVSAALTAEDKITRFGVHPE